MTFWQLTVPSSADTSDGLTNFLWEQGALGVVEEESPTQPARLRAFFADSASSGDLLARVSEYRASLQSLGFQVDPVAPEITPLHDDDWAHAWQQSFPPLLVGARLLIVPPWEARPAGETGGRVQIVIEPGRAFGTGQHGSTEGCLALLDETLASHGAEPVLDIGTGTAILAIAAVKLGAPRASGIDLDPDAIAAARLNAEKNGCGDRIALALQGAEAPLPDEPYPVVVANLLTHTHLGLVGRYRRLVAPGGSLILGGILADEHQAVTNALCDVAFEFKRCRIVDGWASLLLARSVRP